MEKNETECFHKMKKILSSEDILIYPDYKKTFCFGHRHDFAIGAVLSKDEDGKDLPIHFASRTLSKAEEKYSVPEKGMLAIFWALKTFRNYLYGAMFKIIPDH